MPVVAGTKSSDRDACRGVAAKLEACLIAVHHDPTQCQAEMEVVARCCEKYWTKSIHCARLERRRIEGSRDANARVHEKRLRELVENLKPSKHQSK